MGGEQKDVNPELEKGKKKFGGLDRGADCPLSVCGLFFLRPKPLRKSSAATRLRFCRGPETGVEAFWVP
jgi:hypothetical protein